MSNNDLELVKTGQSGHVQHFRIIPQGVASARAINSITEEYGGDSSDVFDEDDGTVNVRPLTINGRGYQYVPFGVDPSAAQGRVGKHDYRPVPAVQHHLLLRSGAALRRQEGEERCR